MNNKYWLLAAAIAAVACAGAVAVVSESSDVEADSSGLTVEAINDSYFSPGKNIYVISVTDRSRTDYTWEIVGGDTSNWSLYAGGVLITGSYTASGVSGLQVKWWGSSGSSAVIVNVWITGDTSTLTTFAVFASSEDPFMTTVNAKSGEQFKYGLSTSDVLATGPMIAVNCSAYSWASISGYSLSGAVPNSTSPTEYDTIIVGWSSNPTQFAYQAFKIAAEHAITLSYGSSSILAITGTAFERTPTTGASGLAINYTISGNPTGVSIDSSTGVLSGSDDPAIAVGTYTLVIKATSATYSANASTVSIKLTVDPVMSKLQYSNSTFSILAGASISATTTATNVSGVTYSANWGGISGLSINSSNGAISGKPDKSGTATVTVSKSGYAVGGTIGGSQQSEAALTVYVQDALTASASASTLYLVTGKAIPFNDSSTLALSASASDGAAITWAVKNAGSTGLTVTSDGAVGGTAGAVNTSGSSVTFVCTSVLNGLTQTKEVSVSIVIKPVLAFTSDPANAVIS